MAGSAVVGVLRALLTLDSAEFVTGTRQAANAAQAWSRDLKSMGAQATALGSSLTKTLTLPIVAMAAGTAKAAIDFESSFAGIAKTVDGVADRFGTLTTFGHTLAQGMRDLSKTIPVNVNELNKIGEAAGQLGIKKDNIVGFTKVMAELGVATNLSSDQAATALARLANITGMSQNDFDKLGSAIVALGNNSATTESEIVDFALRIAGAGTQAGLTEPQILAIGAAMSSVGVEAEAGGTAVQKVLLEMVQATLSGGEKLEQFAAAAGMSAQQFKTAFQQDAGQAFQAFVEGLGSQGQNAITTLSALGLEDQRLIRSVLALAGAGDLLNASMKTSVEGWRANTALSEETARRFATTESQLKQLWIRLQDVGITIGNAFLPLIKASLSALTAWLPVIEHVGKAFAALPLSMQMTIVGVAGLFAAAGPLLFIFGQLVGAAANISGAFGKTGVATRALAFVFGEAGVASTAMAVAMRVAALATAALAPGMNVLNVATTRATAALVSNRLALGLSTATAALATRATALFTATTVLLQGGLTVLVTRLGLSAAAQYAAAAASGVATLAVGALTTALSLLGIALAVVVTAWLAWQFGRWIGEVTGLTDAIGKGTAKLGEWLGLLPKGTAAQYDAMRAAQKQAAATREQAAATADLAQQQRQLAKDRISGADLARELELVTRSITDLNREGQMTPTTWRRAARELENLAAQGAVLTPELQKVVDTWGRMAAVPPSAGQGLVHQLTEMQAALAALTPAQRANIEAGRALGLSTDTISERVGVAAGVIELYKDQVQGAGRVAKAAAKDFAELSGAAAIQEATELTTQLGKGQLRLATMTEDAQRRVATILFAGAEAWRAQGKEVPAAVNAQIAALAQLGIAAQAFADLTGAGAIKEATALATALGRGQLQLAQMTDDAQRQVARVLAEGAEAWRAQGVEVPASVNKQIDAVARLRIIPDALKANRLELAQSLEALASRGVEQLDDQLKQVNESWTSNQKAQLDATRSTAKLRQEIEGQTLENTLALVKTEYDEKRRALDTHGQNYAAALTAIADEEDLALQVAQRQWDAHIAEMKASADTLPNFFRNLFADMPKTIQQAFTGGGGMAGAIKSITSQLGEGLGGRAVTSITQKFMNPLSEGIQGLFGGGKLGSKIFSGFLDMIPGIGGAIGALVAPLIGKLGSALKGLFGVSKQEQEGRTAARDFEASIQRTLTATQLAEAGGVRWKQTVIGVRDAYLATGRSSEEAHAIVERLWAAEKQGAEAVKQVLAEIGGVMDEAQADQERLTAAVQKYGISIEQLGPAMQKQELDKQAKDLIEDWRVLVGSGIAVTTVNEKMAKSINDYLALARKTGAEVPIAMQPIIQKMIETGNLTDENGQAITDMGQLQVRWSRTMGQEFDRLITKLDQLFSKIYGVKTGLEDLPEDTTVRIHYETDSTGSAPPAPESPETLHRGGLIRAHRGWFLGEHLGPGEVPLIGLAGEGITNRWATALLGGRAGLADINAGNWAAVMERLAPLAGAPIANPFSSMPALAGVAEHAGGGTLGAATWPERAPAAGAHEPVINLSFTVNAWSAADFEDTVRTKVAPVVVDAVLRHNVDGTRTKLRRGLK